MELTSLNTLILAVTLLSGLVCTNHQRQHPPEQQHLHEQQQQQQQPQQQQQQQPQEQQQQEQQSRTEPHVSDPQPPEQLSSEEQYPKPQHKQPVKKYLGQDFPEQDPEQDPEHPDKGNHRQLSSEEQYSEERYSEQRKLEEQLSTDSTLQEVPPEQKPPEQKILEGLGNLHRQDGDSTTPITVQDSPDHTLTEPQFIPNNERTETGMTVTAELHNTTVNVTISPTQSQWRCYTVRLSAYYEDTYNRVEDLHDEEYAYSCQSEFQVRNFSFRLPDNLVYFDGQDPGNATSYFVHQVQVYVALMSNMGDLLHDKHVIVDLPEPWSRPQRPRYCGSWGFDLQWRLWWSKVPMCERTYDVNLFSTVVALPGKDIGFTKDLPPRKWPSHAPEHSEFALQSDTRFTVTLWLYITNYCTPTSLCLIFQHRDKGAYLTPLILLNEYGAFHVQLHHQDGSAIAFLSAPETPKRTWIYLVLGIGGVRAELSLSFGDGQSSKEYVHIGSQPFYFNASVGIMAVGGFMGAGMSGYMGPVDLYRDQQMSLRDALRNTIPTRRKLEGLELREQAEDCDWLRPRVCRLVLGHNMDNERYCSGKYWNITLPPSRPSPRSHLHVDGKVLSGYLLTKLREVLSKRKQVFAVYRLETFSQLLYKRTLKLLERRALATPVISRLFEISGCLGDPKGYYAAAVMNKYGFGMEVNLHKVHQLHLIAAHQDYSLAHLALAYKHQLGIDGSPKDISVMAGYLRATAVTTKAIIEREEQSAVTHSEMIRLDQAHQFRNLRGSDSQVVKWLTHQANMGSEEAQTKMAEILYHGREGANVDRNQAVQFYRMAAARNDPSALFNLGVMNLKGINMKKNETKAYEFFKKAAAHNNSIAYNAIAFVELSVHHNRSGAVYYWKKAADLGDGDGLNNYAWMLEQGINPGDPQNHTEALKYYEKAALKGSKNAAIRFADYKINGVHTKRDVAAAAGYYRFVADQLNDMGLCLKEAINAYLDEDWYLSLFHHLFANEAGLQLAGYNTALLLQQYGEEAGKVVKTNDPYHYLNLTAEQGWSLSLIAMGHRAWYNRSGKTDLKKASLYYARSIENNNHPEALFNLGYIVEHGYPLDGGIQMNGVKDFPTMNRNLSMALQLYLSCANSTTDEQEGYYPCQLAAFWIQWKIFLLTNQQIYYLVALVPVAVASIITYIKLH